jgi:hypothetical protein
MKKNVLKLIENLKWLFDYWARDILYGPYGNETYQEFMWNKWGDRYSERYIKDVFNDFTKP